MNMTDREKRWFDNVKKAFHDSDNLVQQGSSEERCDRCLKEMIVAVDTARRLTASLNGKDGKANNKEKFIEFLGFPCDKERQEMNLRDVDSGEVRGYTLGEAIYAIRCVMVHENENLNVAENVDHHILLDWSRRSSRNLGVLRADGVFVANGFCIWEILREKLASFITGIDAMIDFQTKGTFSITCCPELGSIQPDRTPRD